MQFGIFGIATGLYAAEKMGTFAAVQTLVNGGGIQAAAQQITNRCTVTNIIDAALPVVVTQVTKKFVGNRKIFGPINLF